MPPASKRSPARVVSSRFDEKNKRERPRNARIPTTDDILPQASSLDLGNFDCHPSRVKVSFADSFSQCEQTNALRPELTFPPESFTHRLSRQNRKSVLDVPLGGDPPLSTLETFELQCFLALVVALACCKFIIHSEPFKSTSTLTRPGGSPLP